MGDPKRSVSRSIRKKFKKGENSDFEKYGIAVPSYEHCLKHKIELEKYKKIIQNIILEPVPEFSFSELPPKKVFDHRDCKHLSNAELEKYFHENVKYISDIYNGETPSERHQMYKCERASKYLSYNTSMILFTHDQISKLATLMQNYFNDTGLPKHLKYYFQVLLPELCTKIFMDVYNMKREDCMEYLEHQEIDSP